MPDLVKIGCTSQDDISPRLGQLYSTGVPLPFKVEFAARVPNPEIVERALHQAFAPNRVNAKREFFQIDASQAIAILKLLHVEDATREIERVASAVDKEDLMAAEQYRAKRPAMNYIEMGIPIGSTLNFTKGDATVQVIAPRKIQLNGIEMSLTAATRQLLENDYDVAPGPYWTFNGKTVSDIYNETYRGES